MPYRIDGWLRLLAVPSRFILVSTTILTYFLLLASIVDIRGFWLDEVLQLLGTRDLSILELFEYLRTNPGSAPAGYLTQKAFIALLGFSEFSARLPSLISSAVAALAIALIAGRLRPQLELVATLMFIAMPLQFRYALEGRPYLQALCFSILSTLVLLQMAEKVSIPRQLSYAAAVLLGLFSQPFSVFVPIGHLLWIYLSYRDRNRFEIGRTVAATIAFSALLFLPWYLYVSSPWITVIAPMVDDGQGFHFGFKTPFLILKEISGASYWGGAFTLLACAVGLRSTVLDRTHKALLCITIVVPIFGALLADSVFHYFVAIRQMIYAVPSLTILAASGLVSLINKRAWIGGVVLLSFLAICGRYNLAWLHQPGEDWRSAATALHTIDKKACVIFVPADSVKLLRFFEPQLGGRPCPADLSRTPAIVVARSPYSSQADEDRVNKHISANGFEKTDEAVVSKVKIRKYARRENGRVTQL